MANLEEMWSLSVAIAGRLPGSTAICVCFADGKGYDRKMQFRTRKDTLGIYLAHLFEFWHIFLSFGTDWYIPGMPG